MSSSPGPGRLSIKNISMKFDALYHLKHNNWHLVETPEKRKEEKKPPLLVPKKPTTSKPAVRRHKSSDARDKQHQEVRETLPAARQAASVRQNSVTGREDSIEAHAPQSQTQL